MKKKGGKSDKLILLIGVLKLLKGLLLLAAAAGAVKLLHNDLTAELSRWAEFFNADPNSHYFQMALEKVASFDPKKLSLVAVGTFFYSALFLTEGVGLLLRKRWAEYFTVIVTASFLPLEIIEIVKKFNAGKVVLILANAAIVWYLIWRLRNKKKGD